MNVFGRPVGPTLGSGRSYLQIGVAALGTGVTFGAVGWLAAFLASAPASESGFAEGLAIVVFGSYALLGFVLLAAGLAIPQREGSGIHFSTRQRRLLAYGAVAPTVGVLAALVGAAIAPPLPGPIVTAVLALLGAVVLGGPLATLFVVCSKLRGAIARARRTAGRTS